MTEKLVRHNPELRVLAPPVLTAADLLVGDYAIKQVSHAGDACEPLNLVERSVFKVGERELVIDDHPDEVQYRLRGLHVNDHRQRVDEHAYHVVDPVEGR